MLKVGKIYKTLGGESFKILHKKRHLKQIIFIGFKVLENGFLHWYPQVFKKVKNVGRWVELHANGRYGKNYKERDFILEEEENKTC